MATLNIALQETDGVRHVHPDTMQLLLDIAAHADVCDDCDKARKLVDSRYHCTTGRLLMEELCARPDVTVT